MNTCVGIDVSKGKSMVVAMQPFGTVVTPPFEVKHTSEELSQLAEHLKSLDGEICVVMEAAGNYHGPVAFVLAEAGIYVSVVNALLVHDYGNNSLRRVKTNRKDAIKLADYGLAHWLTLPKYAPEEKTRLLLRSCFRQYQQYTKVQTILKNNLISLLDSIFPGVNRLFSSPPKADGSEKWVDIVREFWHCQCVSEFSLKRFNAKYQKWCKSHRYNLVRIKQRKFTILPVVRSASCRKTTLPNFWWNKRFLNFGRRHPHLRRFVKRCKLWRLICRNTLL